MPWSLSVRDGGEGVGGAGTGERACCCKWRMPRSVFVLPALSMEQVPIIGSRGICHCALFAWPDPPCSDGHGASPSEGAGWGTPGAPRRQTSSSGGENADGAPAKMYRPPASRHGAPAERGSPSPSPPTFCAAPPKLVAAIRPCAATVRQGSRGGFCDCGSSSSCVFR